MLVSRRLGIFVYLYYNRDARKVNKFGDFHYHSKAYRYVLLYVPAEQATEIVNQLKSLKFVKEVRVSHIDNIEQPFAGNLTDSPKS